MYMHWPRVKHCILAAECRFRSALGRSGPAWPRALAPTATRCYALLRELDPLAAHKVFHAPGDVAVDLLALHCAAKVAHKAGFEVARSFRSCPGSPEPLVADYGLVGELLCDRPPAVHRLVVETLKSPLRTYPTAIADATLCLMERTGCIARPRRRQRRWLIQTAEFTHFAHKEPTDSHKKKLAEKLADIIGQRRQHNLAPPLARWWRLEIAHAAILVLGLPGTCGGAWAEAGVALAIGSDAALAQLVEECAAAGPHSTRIANAQSALHGKNSHNTHITLQIVDWVTGQLSTLGIWVMPILLVCISIAHVLQRLHGELAETMEPLIADVVWRTLAVADEVGASGATS